MPRRRGFDNHGGPGDADRVQRSPHASALALMLLGCGDAGSVSTATETTTAATSTGDHAVTTGEASTGATTQGTTSLATTPTTDATTGAPAEPPMWDRPFVPPACSLDDGAPLLDEALAWTDLTQASFGFTVADFEQSSQYNNGVLGGDFAFSWLWATRATPARIGCFEGQVAGGLDHALASAHPVASAIRHLAAQIDRPVDDEPPFGPGEGFAAALAELCAASGSKCDAPMGELPEDLAAALAPLLRALSEGIHARLAMDAEPGGDPFFWRDDGGNLSLLANGVAPQPTNPDTRAYLLGLGARVRLYRAAAQIAFAVEDIDWSAFRGRDGVEFTRSTKAGSIRVRDAADHDYPDADEAVLLLVDLGGRDDHRDAAGSNLSGANPVSVVVDLEGDDLYHYDEVASPQDKPPLLPADVDGRAAPSGGYGPYTKSDRSRQGAARNGVAMLFDLGAGADTYRSLRMSQGYAHQGVGVLCDDGGADTYAAEASSQGSGQFGIGLLVDLGDDDDHHDAFTQSQGFGFVGGVGALIDAGGADRYHCDIGDPMFGGLPVYDSPQLPATGNSSFCQGAGFGARNDGNPLASLSGGLGVLRDQAGDDEYDASVFAQGSGYWEGVGVLSDGGGADRYDAAWYVQGGAAHYSVGLLADDGPGADRFNMTRPSTSVNLGSGHDYSLGALLNDEGDDEYYLTGLAAGASNCNGIGLFIDNAGDDDYTAISDLGSGIGNISAECLVARPKAVSIGVMIDAGGVDQYTYPPMNSPGFIVPEEGGQWGYPRFMLPSEHGAGLDGEGVSGVRPESGE